MRHNTLVFPVITKYDVFELRKVYSKNFSLGMTIAVLIHILFIGVYYFIQTTAKSIAKNSPAFTITLADPPSINIPIDPHVAVSSPGSSVKNAIPIPVPDDKAVDDKPFPSQDQLSSSWAQPGNSDGGSINSIPSSVNVEAPGDDIPVMGRFIPVEKGPEIIELITPVYPELARRAGLEGNVFINILVGKDGKPLKAVAVKFDSEIFVKPSVDAAMKSIFTPAIQHKAPVMVWITVPFKFRLNN